MRGLTLAPGLAGRRALVSPRRAGPGPLVSPALGSPALVLLALIPLTLALTGCELTETTATAGLDRVVVEGLVEVAAPLMTPEVGSQTAVRVLLHRTLEGPDGLSRPVDGARVDIVLDDGTRLTLPQVELGECVREAPPAGTGSCYARRWSPVAAASPMPPPMPPAASSADAAGPPPALRPGARIDLDIETLESERLTSLTRLPQSFELAWIGHETACQQPADRPLDVAWTPAEGAWGYLAEAEIAGLPAALAPEGIEVDDDPLLLTGVAVSSSDTTIVFPGEFGVFDRFDLDRDLAVRLQLGVPGGARSRVSVAAVDRNYVNWVRGGNFNPSGQVRVPSVQGDGTGFFGSTVVRWFDVVSGDGVVNTRPVDPLPACAGVPLG